MKFNPNVQWDKIFYGRKLMDQIITTIETKNILSGVYLKRYLFRAMMAGFIIANIVMFSMRIRTDFADAFPPGMVNLLASFCFSFALVLILFTNSELLTSNFMYFTVGLYYKKIKPMYASRIFLLCFTGNVLGAIVLFLLVKQSSIINPDMADLLLKTTTAKSNSGALDIFIKAIFANFFINISVVIAMQLDDIFARMFVMMFGVMIFAFMGYEHVIANAAIFTGAFFYHPESVNMLLVLKNLFFSFWGNYVGGGLIIGLFYAYLNDHSHIDVDKANYIKE